MYTSIHSNYDSCLLIPRECTIHSPNAPILSDFECSRTNLQFQLHTAINKIKQFTATVC